MGQDTAVKFLIWGTVSIALAGFALAIAVPLSFPIALAWRAFHG